MTRKADPAGGHDHVASGTFREYLGSFVGLLKNRTLTLILLVAALYIAAAFVNRYLTRNRA